MESTVALTWMQLADSRQSVPLPQKTMARIPLLLAYAIAALAPGSGGREPDRQAVPPAPDRLREVLAGVS
jgi:hypothetical protein